MTLASVGVTFAMVWWLTPPGSSQALRRLAPAALAGSPPASRPRVSWIEDPARRAASCACAGSVVMWTLGGPWLAVAGLGGGLVLSWWLGRLEAPSVVKARQAVRRDLPLMVDLMAACALAGRPAEQSLELVSRSVGGALDARLRAMIARLRLGADPVTEWRRLADDRELAPLARVMMRCVESGAPLAEGLARLAADCRRARRTETQLRARAVGVKAAGPLAACFLPAFMLIGVVPTIAGAFANLIL